MRRLLIVIMISHLVIMVASGSAQQQPEEILKAVVKVRSAIPDSALTAPLLGTEREGNGILIDSDETGPALVEDPKHRALYVFNHFEYDSNTLKEEYDRDVANGTPINVPANYYPDDDPSKQPQNRWRSHAHLLFGNWISEIYLTTPFDMDQIGQASTDWRNK